MVKCIKIEKCSQCQHKNHRGGFGAVAYIPYCSKKGATLPYTKSIVGNMIAARQTDEIPEWCPLEEYAPPPVSHADASKAEDGEWQ